MLGTGSFLWVAITKGNTKSATASTFDLKDMSREFLIER